MKFMLSAIYIFVCLSVYGQAPITVKPVVTCWLYQGIDNDVEIKGISTLTKPRVRVNNGEVRNLGGEYFIITPIFYMPCVVTIEDDSKMIASFDVRVKELPEPDIYLQDTICSGIMKIEKLKSLTQLYLNRPHLDFDIPINIHSFKITRISKQAVSTIVNWGKNFNNNALDLLSNAKTGDILIFDSVVFTSLKEKRELRKSLVLRVR